jgi:hypothetical protein
MSGYTVGEIGLWLLLAAVLGFGLGWIARELLLRTSRGAGDSPVVRPADPGPIEPTASTTPAPVGKSSAENAQAKTPVRKTSATKTPAKKSAAAVKPAAKKTAAAAAAKKPAAKKSAAKKTGAKKSPAKKAAPSARSATLDDA